MSNRKTLPGSAGQTKGNEENKLTSSQPRRSPRSSGRGKDETVKIPQPPVKRSITVRKIAPRKTQVPETPILPARRSPRISAEGNKENSGSSAGKLEKVKRAPAVPDHAPAQTSPHQTVLSPIPAPASPAAQVNQELGSLEWSHKVRRSYSRLSYGDRSFEGPPCSPAPCRRDTFFGFEHLQTPPVVPRKAEQSRLRTEVSICGGSFSLLEGSTCVAGSPEPDLNIPGVVVVKEKRKRIRAPQIKMSELDLLAAKMNAEFEEAECFDLVVE